MKNIAGQDAEAIQAVGGIVIDMDASGAEGTTAGTIFKGLAMGISDNQSPEGSTWTIPLVGLEKKMEDIALINVPFFDGRTGAVTLDFLTRYAGLVSDSVGTVQESCDRRRRCRCGRLDFSQHGRRHLGGHRGRHGLIRWGCPRLRLGAYPCEEVPPANTRSPIPGLAYQYLYSPGVLLRSGTGTRVSAHVCAGGWGGRWKLGRYNEGASKY